MGSEPVAGSMTGVSVPVTFGKYPAPERSTWACSAESSVVHSSTPLWDEFEDAGEHAASVMAVRAAHATAPIFRSVDVMSVQSPSQWKASPQAQVFCAFGLSMVKPWRSMVSAKSMVAPAR